MTVEALKAVEGITSREAERSKNFFALGLMLWLYHRPTEGTLAFIEQKFGKQPAIAEANTRAFKAGYNYGETSEDFAVSYEVAPAASGAGPLPPDHGQHGDELRPPRRLQALRAAALPRRVPDHAGVVDSRGALAAQELRRHDLPGRGRDRRVRRGPRRVVRRRARRDDLGRAGNRPQGRDGRSRRHARAAAPDPRHPARRPVDGDADEARAGRPADGALRPQRREPGSRRRRLEPVTVLPCRDRGCPDLAQVPHARVPALGCRARERLGAVADPGRLAAPLDRDGVRDRPRTTATPSTRTCAIPSRSPGPGPCRELRASRTASAGSRRRM